jgi:twitching motility two-component system response regulator PilH
MSTKILLIEDGAVERYRIKTLLEGHGYQVVEAEDGEAGLAAAQVHKPAVIILDVVMPRMNGYQTIRALRDDPETMMIPVIFLSSKDQPHDKLYGERQGACFYMTKPVIPEDLLHNIRLLS